MLKRALFLSAGASGLIFVLTACGGSGDTDTTGTNDTTPDVGDDDDDDTDTGTGSGYLDPKTLFLGGWFGYDEDAGTTVGTLYDGSAITSEMYIRIGTASFTGDINDQANHCTIYVNIDNASNESWATDGGYLFGLIAPQGSPDVTDDCLDKGFDPDWFGGAPADIATTYPLGFAIGGEPSTVVTDWMAQVGVDPADEDLYIGGVFNGDSWGLPDSNDAIYWSAYEVDNAMNIDFEATVDKFSISDGNGGLATGFYEFGLVYYWTFQ